MNKIIIPAFLAFLLFSCNNPNVKLKLEQICLKENNGKEKIFQQLSELKNETDTSKRLSVTYSFTIDNLQKAKFGLLQTDPYACFQAFLNGKLVLERKNYTFFQDTLLAERRDSAIYSDDLPTNYRIHSKNLQNSLLKGENHLTLRFLNAKYYKLDHRKTNLILTNNKRNFPNNNPEKVFCPSGLPWVSIQCKNGIQDEPKSPAEMTIKEGKKTVHLQVRIEIRGTTSQSFPKKSFSFVLNNSENKPLKKQLLGMPSHENWILYGPYADKSLIRNVLAYQLWENIGHYAPQTRFCELSINGFYQGVYVLCEKIQVDTNRLPLNDGYLMKIDRPQGYFFQSNVKKDGVPNTVFEFVHPIPSEMSASEKINAEELVHYFEESLFNSDKNALLIFEMIDMQSFVDYLIINELFRNIDAYRLSTYFQITEDKKIVMGPVWDFNFSFGLTDYLDGYKSDGFVYQKMKEVPFWWEKLSENIFFRKALSNRWKELRKKELSEKSVTHLVSKYAKELKIAQENNFEKWHLLGEKEVWPNYFIGSTHQEEIDYLQNWYIQRMKWLDTQWK